MLAFRLLICCCAALTAVGCSGEKGDVPALVVVLRPMNASTASSSEGLVSVREHLREAGAGVLVSITESIATERIIDGNRCLGIVLMPRGPEKEAPRMAPVLEAFACLTQGNGYADVHLYIRCIVPVELDLQEARDGIARDIRDGMIYRNGHSLPPGDYHLVVHVSGERH